MPPLIVVPARFGSRRISGKPLSKIHDEPLIALVVRRVLGFGLSTNVVVATDDSRIENAVAREGVRVVQTSSQHRSGTERVAEVVARPEFRAANPILNVQGDQLFLPRRAALGSLDQLENGFSIGTAAGRLERHHETDPNRVKVAVDQCYRACSFSRSMPANSLESSGTRRVFLHLGVYAYTREALLQWIALPATKAEIDLGLEQLRPFLNGIPIGVAILNHTVEPGIDIPEDLVKARGSLALTRTNT